VPALPPAHVRLVRSLHEKKSVGEGREAAGAQYRAAASRPGDPVFGEPL